MGEYRKALGDRPFAETLEALNDEYKTLQQEAKAAVEAVTRKDKKQLKKKYDDLLAEKNGTITTAKEAVWLFEKFGEGEYRDIPGLCKLADRETIQEKNYSLTPGAYVGVAAVEDDGVDFRQRMREIHEELVRLQGESDRLMEEISRNMKEMGV